LTKILSKTEPACVRADFYNSIAELHFFEVLQLVWLQLRTLHSHAHALPLNFIHPCKILQQYIQVAKCPGQVLIVGKKCLVGCKLLIFFILRGTGFCVIAIARLYKIYTDLPATGLENFD
jgi:hypothetical protein